MKVFDARCLPPIPAARKTFVYTKASLEGRTKRGVPIDDLLLHGGTEDFVRNFIANGVEKVIAVGRPVGPGPNYGGTYEGVGNDEILAFAKAHSDRAMALAAIDGNAIARPDAEIAALKERGFVGILMMPGWCPGHLHVDDPALERIYKAVNAAKLPLYLMGGGFAGPDISWSDPARFDRVAAAYPQMTIVMVYGGHPYVQAAMGVIYRRTNVFCMPDSYFPGVTGEADYISAMRTYGADRFLYSSNFPLFSYENHLARIADLHLPDDIMEKFLWRNAERLFLS